ncbi:RING zinc finger containing protein [Babesia ovata]|uniref:RING zinc finger containing protein n=1 Tax=Babesia ovata TaxID=189622 RepID=A0A2H6KEA0_9APIC|nr:RING zinc finger containing protein [Babesia ovata]GBE61315.1 RING zinc finger containing protein [Babesia ovata]
MTSPHCGFLFGAADNGRGKCVVLERLHLATRGVGDWESLARTLGEYRCSRRFLTEGSTILVRRTKRGSPGLARAFSGVTSTHGNDVVVSDVPRSGLLSHKGDSEAPFSPNDGSFDADNVAYRRFSGSEGERAADSTNHQSPGVTSSVSDSSKERGSDAESEHAQRPGSTGASTSFFSVCSAAFELTRSFSCREPPISTDDSVEYVVVKCEPSGGYIGKDTVLYTDERLPVLSRVDLLWDVENESHVQRCVGHLLGPNNSSKLTKAILLQQERLFGPYRVESIGTGSIASCVRKTIFLNSSDERMADGNTQSHGSTLETFNATETLFQKMFRYILMSALSSDFLVFYPGRTLTVRDLRMFVSRTAPCTRPGIIGPSTKIYVGVDTVGECASVSVAPLRDTLPTTYEYNLLKDCVEPYFRGHRSRTFQVDDVFRFGGVQFRVVGFEHQREEPTHFLNFDLMSPFARRGSCGRVGARSEIRVSDPVDPRLTDLLSAEQLRHLRRCAPNQRELLMFKLASQLDMDSIGRLYGHNDNAQRGVSFERIETSYSGYHRSFSSTLTDTVHQYNIGDTPVATITPSSGWSDQMCTVCCEAIDEAAPSGIFTYACGHVFHEKCAREWINMCGTSCPNCRHCSMEVSAPCDTGDAYAFHTLSDCDDTDMSDNCAESVNHESGSSSGTSELLHWFNSQEA